jgi:hypothetical protein
VGVGGGTCVENCDLKKYHPHSFTLDYYKFVVTRNFKFLAFVIKVFQNLPNTFSANDVYASKYDLPVQFYSVDMAGTEMV